MRACGCCRAACDIACAAFHAEAVEALARAALDDIMAAALPVGRARDAALCLTLPVRTGADGSRNGERRGHRAARRAGEGRAIMAARARAVRDAGAAWCDRIDGAAARDDAARAAEMPLIGSHYRRAQAARIGAARDLPGLKARAERGRRDGEARCLRAAGEDEIGRAAHHRADGAADALDDGAVTDDGTASDAGMMRDAMGRCGPRCVHHLKGPATQKSAAASAGAQFRKGHSHRHAQLLSLPSMRPLSLCRT